MAWFRALLALSFTTLAGALVVTPAQAASVVVQGRFPGPDLIAHRYVAPAAGNETLTVVTPTTPADTPGTWATNTTLDFDRDGKADAMVAIYGPTPVSYRVLKLTPGATVPSVDREHDTCLVPDTVTGAATQVASGGLVGVTPRASSRAVSLSLDFDAWFGTIARYQPIMTTFWTPAASAGGSQSAVYDYLPDAAGPPDGSRAPIDNACRGIVGGNVQAWGFVLDSAKGDDREVPNGEVPRSQRMADRHEMATGESDLVQADVDQFIANRYATDLSADAPTTTGTQPTFNPADLTLTFAPAGALDSATYFHPSGVGPTPFALLKTSGSPGADHVTVTMQTGLQGITSTAEPQCFPRDGSTVLPGGTTAWGDGGDRVTLSLPVTRDGQGRPTVKVALDRVLGVFANNGTGNRTTFGWSPTTLPVGEGDPDYAPDYNGQDYGTKFSACTIAGAPGTVLQLANAPFLDGAAFNAALTLTPSAPQRDEPVTLTASPNLGGSIYRFDLDGDGLFDSSAQETSPTRTQTYNARTPATVFIRQPGGNYSVAVVDVAPADPPPVAAFTADAPAPFTLGPAGATVAWTDTSTDDHHIIKTRTWTLRHGTTVITCPVADNCQPFSHTFSDGDAGEWTLELTVTDDEDVPGTKTETFQVLAGDGGPGTGPTAARIALLTQGKVYAKRNVTYTAARSSVRVGPAHFAWDLDGDGTFETDTGRQATVTTAYDGPGHREVRVRLDDGAGGSSTSAPLGVDVAPATDQAPSVVLNAPESVTLNKSSVSAALDATGSTGRNEDPSLTFAWDLDGDGVFETGTGAIPKATATFTTSGDHVVRVRASDVFGNRTVVAKTIFVRGSAEIAANCVGREQFRSVSYGPARVSACWTKVDRPSSGPLWIARGDVGLNGLRLRKGTKGSAPRRAFADCAGDCVAAQSAFSDAGQGARIVFDPYDGTLKSNGPIAVGAEGSGVKLVLNDGPLDLTLPATTSKDEDGIILHPSGGAALFSLKLADEAEVRFPADGEATVAMSVHLPPQMPGVGGDVTLRSTQTDGIILDHLKIEVQTGLLSDYLKLANLSVEYDRADQQWTGHAELGLPGIKGKEFSIEAEIVIANGRFKSIYGAVDGLGINLGEGIYLQRIRAGVGVDPLDLQGGIGLSAGPKIAGTQIFSVDGDVRLTFPSTKYPFAVFQIAGNTKMLDEIELTKGVFRFATNGFFEARGGISRQVGLGYFDADIGGWFTFDKANLTGNAEVGIKFLGDKIKLAEAHAVLSTKGIAACGTIPVIDVGGGIGYLWNGKTTIFRGCDLGPYSEARPEGIPDGFEVRAAAVSAPALTLPAGLRSVNVAVHGRGAPPKVRLVDAKGQTVVDATAEQLTKKAMVIQDADNATTQIVVKAPAKGKYLVVAAAGSAAIAKVEHAEDAGPQRVRATISGPGAKRTLRWTVTPRLQKGQQLTLGEAAALDGAGSEVVSTTKSSGSTAFVPEEGHGERRVVTATILTGGLGRPPTVAARFTAPRTTTPARPRGVTLTRKGRSVTLAWAAATPAPAGGWRVALEAGGLRAVRTLVAGTSHRYMLLDVPAASPVTAAVVGLTSGRRAGQTAKAQLAAGASRSGAGSAADARPRALTARRAGRTLVVRWRGGPERVKGFAVRVRVGTRKAMLLHANPAKRTVSVAGLPKGAATVRVEVRAERFGGGTSRAVTLSGRR
ncbi:MAG TPA: PKD domain-containing protein [Baekduia sp.]|uniref:PKD domain-containing protein n=1 Tax=Baekduia sp. TaxID=2600305 RepID=UPI002B662C32|nr:PKD domain-containing protein [Baekduia sp.]HMJ33315.1 PKD domain-containing protein [Baekduia sp.]